MAISEDLIKQYETDLDRLEWKYIQANADIVKEIQRKQSEFNNEIDELDRQFETEDSEYTWWSNLLYMDANHDERQLDQLMRKIIFDIKDQYKIIDFSV